MISQMYPKTSTNRQGSKFFLTDSVHQPWKRKNRTSRLNASGTMKVPLKAISNRKMNFTGYGSKRNSTDHTSYRTNDFSKNAKGYINLKTMITRDQFYNLTTQATDYPSSKPTLNRTLKFIRLGSPRLSESFDYDRHPQLNTGKLNLGSKSNRNDFKPKKKLRGFEIKN